MGLTAPIITAIRADDGKAVLGFSAARLITGAATKDELYTGDIDHWLYERDTYLHLAAAGHRARACTALLQRGCAVDRADNRRKATPLHYASDGLIGVASYDETRQVKTLEILLAHGARVDAVDANGATPLHRAVRTRCDRAVEVLLAAGCPVHAANKSGSTAWDLAQVTSGRGGSGSDEAKRRQQRIIALLRAHGADGTAKPGGKG